jgi:hypothetical protein
MSSPDLAALESSLERMRRDFVPEAAGGFEVAYQFHLREPAFEFYAEVRDGRITVSRGLHPAPHVTLELTAADWLEHVSNPDADPAAPQQLFMTGRIRAEPLDPERLLRLGTLFGQA